MATTTFSGPVNSTAGFEIDGTAITASAAELNILDGVTATAAEINAAADVSSRVVIVPNSNYEFLVANSGKPHIIEDVSADRTFQLPEEAPGLDFELIATVGAADGHDWIITSNASSGYVGGVLHIDTDADAAGDEAVLVAASTDEFTLQVNLPAGGTRLRFISYGSSWMVNGVVVSATAPAFSS